MDLNRSVQYFKECYQADNRDLTISNFFSDKVEKRLLMKGEDELINGFLPYSPVDSDKAIEMQKILKLYSKEKELLYCSLFIIGNNGDLCRKRKTILLNTKFVPLVSIILMFLSLKSLVDL